MIKPWIFSLFASSVLLLAAPAQSQTEAEPSEETSSVVQQKPSEPAQSSERNEDSPYDYQASEEISEDLSVSFPVDI